MFCFNKKFDFQNKRVAASASKNRIKIFFGDLCFYSRSAKIPGIQKRQSVTTAFECRGRTVLAESLVSPPSTVARLRRRQLLVRHGLRPQVELLPVLVERLQIVEVINFNEKNYLVISFRTVFEKRVCKLTINIETNIKTLKKLTLTLTLCRFSMFEINVNVGADQFETFRAVIPNQSAVKRCQGCHQIFNLLPFLTTSGATKSQFLPGR
jgi:hypothetical protein